MNGVGWSCFAQLPAGLIDPQAASLTLNWLRPKPTHAGFKLKRDEVDAQRYTRNLRIQRQTVIAGGIVAAAILAVMVADQFLELRRAVHPMIVFFGVWAGASGIALAFLMYLACTFGIMRFRRAEPRREAFHSACAEFERVDAWRAERCDPAFWRDTLDEAAFELEAAELLAGHFKTGQVMLTRADGDYGVDVLLCAPRGRIVARCRQWKAYRVGTPQVRELAGSKGFFAADAAVLVFLNGPGEDREECEAFALSLQLELWDLDRIAAVAADLREPM